MKEYVILIDPNDNEIGTEQKIEAHVKGKLHRGFSTLIMDENDNILIHKRSKNKYHSPGLWTAPCCGHPRPGESYEDASKRRLKEEMGFTCNLQKAYDGIYKIDLGNMWEHEYGWVMKGRVNSNEVSIAPDPTEVEGYEWIGLNDLSKDAKNNPDKYTYWFRIMIDKTEKYLSKQM